jgi:lycopene beta-cyclase
MFDALVLGAGPAGIALAAALSAHGLRVAVVAPDAPVNAPPAWRPTYCAWQDELDAVGHGAHTDQRWPGAVARFGPDAVGVPRVHDLDRAYVRVDKAALAAALYAQCGGVTWVAGAVGSVAHSITGSTVTLHDGSTVEAAVVIDAAGHRPALLKLPATPAPALQTAVGRVLPLARSPWPADRAGLMDIDPLPGDDGGPATFLYVLPLADGRVFVEETCLAARPGVPAAELTARLDRRLAAWGVPGASDAPEEWVSIPMGGEVPHDPRVLGFGAAAGMIHPATGYLLPRVLAAAPVVAEQVALALGARGGTPARAVAAGWEALWPRDRRQRRALYRFGLEALLAMDPVTTRAFFHHFFTLPPPLWSGYLSDGLTAAELRVVMLTLFGRVPFGLKWSLARAGFGAEGVALARSMVGG